MIDGMRASTVLDPWMTIKPVAQGDRSAIMDRSSPVQS
jgi:hypothetical protein